MAVDDRLQDMLSTVKALREGQREQDARGLNKGGGGGTSGGMEERIVRLEAHTEHAAKAIDRLVVGQDGLRDQSTRIETRASVIEEQLRHVPTIAKMWSAAIAIVVALGGVIALAVRFIPHAG